MKRPENDKWLDEALSEAIGSKKTRTDFETWKQKHPKAVEMLTSRADKEAPASSVPSTIRRIIMTSTITKLAAAAVLVIAAAVGITQFVDSNEKSSTNTGLVLGPKTIKLIDGSEVKLAQGAKIQVPKGTGKRGFEHITGQIEVNVTRGKGQFVVTTPYGNVTALGTEFNMDLVDGVTANTKEHVELLSVEVTEGSVEVSNDKGSSVLKERQKAVVEKNQAPYNIAQDDAVPARLKERMTAMVNAIETGNTQAYIDNYNINYLYKLVKGEVEYDSNLFGGTVEDARRLQKTFGNIASVEALNEALQQGLNLKDPAKVYLRDIEVSEDGKHAKAGLVKGDIAGNMVGSFPEWHYFDNDWWQVDD
jgi:ferric-dicitrate binding protein FerR (iron transport regulator)